MIPKLARINFLTQFEALESRPCAGRSGSLFIVSGVRLHNGSCEGFLFIITGHIH